MFSKLSLLQLYVARNGLKKEKHIHKISAEELGNELDDVTELGYDSTITLYQREIDSREAEYESKKGPNQCECTGCENEGTNIWGGRLHCFDCLPPMIQEGRQRR